MLSVETLLLMSKLKLKWCTVYTLGTGVASLREVGSPLPVSVHSIVVSPKSQLPQRGIMNIMYIQTQTRDSRIRSQIHRRQRTQNSTLNAGIATKIMPN